MAKTGRPTKYTKVLGTKICVRIAEGESVRKICRDESMPSAKTIFNWLLDENKKEFLQQYETAIKVRAELMFEELIEIADDTEGDVMRDRLRVDTRKWNLSKMFPRKYGDKLDLTTKGDKLPTPILDLNVLRNDSDKEDSETEQED